MTKQPFLTADEELALLKLAHFAETESERIAARNELVTRNLNLIFRATRQTRRWGFSVEECLSVAVEAWLYSISRYNFQGTRLSTYAVTAVRHKVSRWAREQCGVVRFPAANHSATQLAKRGDDVQRAVEVVKKRPLSTDYTPKDAGGDEFMSMGQQIPFRDEPEYDDGPTVADLRAAIKLLEPRLYAVMRLRLWGLTLDEIGQLFEVSRERIRQLEAKAVKHLRRALGGHVGAR